MDVGPIKQIYRLKSKRMSNDYLNSSYREKLTFSKFRFHFTKSAPKWLYELLLILAIEDGRSVDNQNKAALVINIYLQNYCSVLLKVLMISVFKS